MLKSVFAVAVFLAGVFGQNTHHPSHHIGTSICKFIQNADCTITASHQFCGTNAVTYQNQCEFSKAHCLDGNLHIKHNGTCDPTIDKVIPDHHGNDLVYQFFCANLQHSPCGTDLEIVCGEDMKTYDNLCLFEKARCAAPELNVYTYQACPALK